jgi:hypothetical protein
VNLSGIDPWFRIIFLIALLSALATRFGQFWQWLSRRRDRDNEKLATALRAELAALHELYDTNLRLIADDSGYLLSAKCFATVYRSCLARLNQLPAAAIAPVVSVYTRNERIEALLAARAAALHRREPPPAGPPREALQLEFLAGCAAVAEALAALAPAAEAEPSPAAASGQAMTGTAVTMPRA